jgi:hypothetical protein
LPPGYNAGDPMVYPGQPAQQAPPAQPRVAGPLRQRLQPQANNQGQASAPAQQTRTAATVRGQNGEPDPVPAKPQTLQMPSPEALGIQRSRNVEVDWNSVQRRLNRLSITSFRSEKQPDGSFRFTCVVPALDRPKKIEAEAINEADAIDQALRQAEEWVSRR